MHTSDDLLLTENLSLVMATSPNKLTAALTDWNGALVSISPTSPLGEFNFLRPFIFFALNWKNGLQN